MEQSCIHIEGGQPLQGQVAISGAKNSALPCLFATLLSEDSSTLGNLPHVQDIKTTLQVLKQLGYPSTIDSDSVTINPLASEVKTEIPLDLARSMRASILTLGPLLAMRGLAIVPLPGGCDFGERPINIHLQGLEKMGANINLQDGILRATSKRLHGAHLVLDYPTFTGTENLMMAATLATGTTVIENAGREPEIVDLATMLNGMGAKINGAGTATIVVEGVPSLHGAQHTIMPDRIEAGTYLALVTATTGAVTLTNIQAELLTIVLEKLAAAGASITNGSNTIELNMAGQPKSFDLVTAPYPGFPTDLQAQMMAVNAVASGQATIVEQVWHQRFRTAIELVLLGAHIAVQGNRAVVTGVPSLVGEHVQATDLRASAALVIAGLCAKGTTVIHGIHHLKRGYEDMPGKLRTLGANIKEV